MNRRTNLVLASFVITISAIAGVAYAMVQLNIPSVTVTSPNGAARMTSFCGGALNVEGTPPFPASGNLEYSCDATHGAFTVAVTGWDTPIFKLPGNYTSLAAIVKGAACPNLSQIPLTNNTQVQFVKGGDYDLCSAYSSTTGGTLQGFTFEWIS